MNTTTSFTQDTLTTRSRTTAAELANLTGRPVTISEQENANHCMLHFEAVPGVRVFAHIWPDADVQFRCLDFDADYQTSSLEDMVERLIAHVAAQTGGEVKSEMLFDEARDAVVCRISASHPAVPQTWETVLEFGGTFYRPMLDAASWVAAMARLYDSRRTAMDGETVIQPAVAQIRDVA